MSHIAGVANTNIVSNLNPDCVPPVSEHDNGTPSAQQAGNTRKLPVEQITPQMYFPDHFYILC